MVKIKWCDTLNKKQLFTAWIIGLLLVISTLAGASATVDNTGISYVSDATQALKGGMQIRVTNDGTLNYFNVSSDCTDITKGQLLDNSTHEELESCTFVDQGCQLDYSITAGDYYLLVFDNNGSDYNRKYKLGVSYPIVGTNIDFIADIYDDGEGLVIATSNGRCMESVTTTIASGEPPEVTNNLPANNSHQNSIEYFSALITDPDNATGLTCDLYINDSKIPTTYTDGELTISGTNVTKGKIANAYGFDGTSDYVKSNNTYNISTNDFTLSTWIYLNHKDGDHQTFISKGETSAEDLLFYINGADELACYSGSGTLSLSYSNYDANEWLHFACKRNSTGAYLYVNGTIVDSDTSANTDITSSHFWTFASSNDGTGRYLNGSIDDARIYNTGLNDSRILSIYNNGVGNEFENVSSANIVEHLLFNVGGHDNNTYVNHTVINNSFFTSGETYDWHYRCSDGAEYTNSDDWTVTIDDNQPLINIYSPTGTHNYSVLENLSLNISITDPEGLLFAMDINITGADGTVYWNYNLTNMSVDGINITNITDISSLPLQEYTVRVYAEDEHTAKKWDKYSLSKNKDYRKLYFTDLTDSMSNEYVNVEMVATDTPIKELTTNKEKDRITFNYEMTKNKKKDHVYSYTFLVIS
jgi:hypothetical protein